MMGVDAVEMDDLHTCLVAAFAEHDLLVVAEAHLPHDDVTLVKLASTSPSCRVHTAVADPRKC